MNKFYKDIEKLYNKKKNLPNPPEYIKTIEELLKLHKSN